MQAEKVVKKLDASGNNQVTISMTEKQAKAAFVRQLKPAVNAIKKLSRPKYASAFSVVLTHLDDRINVKWALTGSRHVKPLAVGFYGVSVPVPTCVKFAGYIAASGPADVRQTLNKIIEAAK